MSKSKYPSELDTSVEIPAIRDNITEIGSDTFNAIRDAIFKIERTLGINPHGATGSTVAERLNKVVDGNGNILETALDKANVLSGPIIDADVSDVAAIRENKLKLNVPTGVLQSQVSEIDARLTAIILQLTALSAQFAAHVNPASLNRHKGTAISLTAATTLPNDIATLSLEAASLQATIETLYNAHINYSGNNISSLNNSHKAGQVYFDNEGLASIIPSDDVQGALEDVANLQSVGLRDSTLNLNSNGRIRTGSVIDGYEGNELGTVLLDSVTATFTHAGGASRTSFLLNAATSSLGAINENDILTLSGSETTTDNISYSISKVTLDGSDNVTAIEVYGGPKVQSTEELTVTVTRNIYAVYNQNGFNATVRPRKNKTNTPDIVIANPDAATIISEGIMPAAITSTEHTFDIKIDGGSAITIDTYDSTVARQTLDSIVNKINEQAVDQHLNFYAYKLRTSTCYVLAITHVVPNSGNDIKNRTIRIETGSSNDGTAILGFTDSLDIDIEGTTTNAFHINGLLLSDFEPYAQYTGTSIEIVQNTLNLSFFSTTPLTEGVRIGDTATITNSSEPADDGSYRVGSILGNSVTLDLSGNTLTGTLDENSLVQFYRNSARLEELNFTESISVTGSILIDIFITEDKDVQYRKRLEIENELVSGEFAAAISDVSRNFIVAEDTATLVINTDGTAILTGPNGIPGEATFVAATGEYKVFGSDRLSFITLTVNSSDLPSVQQTVAIYGFAEVGRDVYWVSRALFGTSLGIVLGESTDIGVPKITDKRISGTVDDTIISEPVLERYIQGPRNELRGSGIIRGMEVSNAQLIDSGEVDSFANPIYYQTVDVSAGVAVVNGIRYEFPGVLDFRVNTSNDFYLVMDGRGCVLAGDQIINPDGYTDGYVDAISPFTSQVVANLAFIDAPSGDITDLRLFVDHIDYKLIGDVIVANTQDFGHFTDIETAIKYVDRFTEMFPEQSTPGVFIAEGTHEISSSILIDFDLTIRGSGPKTILSKTGSFAEGEVVSSGEPDMRSCLFLMGGSRDSNSTRIIDGITFKDFTYKTSNELTNVGSVFSLAQEVSGSASLNATFRFEDITFIGPSGINEGGGIDADRIGEYALIVGQQTGSTFSPLGNLEMGNIIFNGCHLKRMGAEEGGVLLLNSAGGTFKNIVVTGNIAEGMSPNLGDTSFAIINYPASPTITNVVEASNATSA